MFIINIVVVTPLNGPIVAALTFQNDDSAKLDEDLSDTIITPLKEKQTNKTKTTNFTLFSSLLQKKLTENLASFFSRLNSLKVPGVCVCVMCVYIF